jgi:hypothetical protein
MIQGAEAPGRCAAAHTQSPASVLEFGHSASHAQGATDPTERPLDVEEVLASVRETAYPWDLASDRIEWAANAQAVLGLPGREAIAKGRAFALLVPRAGRGPL